MITAVVFFAVFGLALCGRQCRDGWYLGNQERSCYKAHNFQTSWAEAFTYCTVMRAQLADITSREELESVGKILETQYNGSYPQFWIDLTDLATEGEWRLMSTNMEATFLPWIVNQPNNGQGGREHCAHINAKPRRHFMWNDHNCQAKLNFLCESHPEGSMVTADDATDPIADYAEYYNDYFSSLYV